MFPEEQTVRRCRRKPSRRCRAWQWQHLRMRHQACHAGTLDGRTEEVLIINTPFFTVFFWKRSVAGADAWDGRAVKR